MLRILLSCLLLTIISLPCSCRENRNPGNPLLRIDGNVTKSCQILSYNALHIVWSPRLRQPLAVAYELTDTHVAMCDAPDAEKRKHYNFATDTSVKNCPEPYEISFSKCGYSRGHMAPAMDMKWSKATMTQCFLMTNICPQDKELNNGQWQSIERNVHQWAKRHRNLIVITGPVFKTTQWLPPRRNIGLPTHFYKIVYAPGKQRAIAFLYPNTPPQGTIKSHVTTIEHIEKLTGLQFLNSLDRKTRRQIKQYSNYNLWDQK